MCQPVIILKGNITLLYLRIRAEFENTKKIRLYIGFSEELLESYR
jgi:hypothetical protein